MPKRRTQLSPSAREALTSSFESQNQAHAKGAYDYLKSVHLAPRFGVVSAFIRQLGSRSILDIGCGSGLLRGYLDREVGYLGIDVSAVAISEATVNGLNHGTASYICAQFESVHLANYVADCVVWMGVGAGCVRNSAAPASGWRRIIERMRSFTGVGGACIVECIDSYREQVEHLTRHFTVISECMIICESSDAHPVRYVRVMRT